MSDLAEGIDDVTAEGYMQKEINDLRAEVERLKGQVEEQSKWIIYQKDRHATLKSRHEALVIALKEISGTKEDWGNGAVYPTPSAKIAIEALQKDEVGRE